jgi:hypothetical protein
LLCNRLLSKKILLRKRSRKGTKKLHHDNMKTVAEVSQPSFHQHQPSGKQHLGTSWQGLQKWEP